MLMMVVDIDHYQICNKLHLFSEQKRKGELRTPTCIQGAVTRIQMPNFPPQNPSPLSLESLFFYMTPDIEYQLIIHLFKTANQSDIE